MPTRSRTAPHSLNEVKNYMVNKILGYLLILIGLAIIFTTLFGSYKVFTGGLPLPEIFKVAEKNGSPSGNQKQDLQAQMEQTIREQIGNILPVDSLTKLLNLISFSILAGILIFGGGQVAGIGIKLISTRANF